MQLTIDTFTEAKKIQSSFQSSMQDIRLELDEHLDSINQNSTEIQANYDYLEELNQKIDKLTARMDEISAFFLKEKKEQQQVSFTEHEKEIFLVLYTAQEPLSYEEIAARASLPLYLVEDAITSMKFKQIPLIKKTFANKVLVLLEDSFKEAQKKFNVVDIQTNVLSNWC